MPVLISQCSFVSLISFHIFFSLLYISCSFSVCTCYAFFSRSIYLLLLIILIFSVFFGFLHLSLSLFSSFYFSIFPSFSIWLLLYSSFQPFSFSSFLSVFVITFYIFLSSLYISLPLSISACYYLPLVPSIFFSLPFLIFQTHWVFLVSFLISLFVFQ